MIMGFFGEANIKVEPDVVHWLQGATKRGFTRHVFNMVCYITSCQQINSIILNGIIEKSIKGHVKLSVKKNFKSEVRSYSFNINTIKPPLRTP